jgi:hypothetical protein
MQIFSTQRLALQVQLLVSSPALQLGFVVPF